MSLQLLGHIELPDNLETGGFDHAAVHGGSNRLYVAHTANDALDVIDCVKDRYSHSIENLTGVAGALVSNEQNLVFTSNRGENTVGIFAPVMERIQTVPTERDAHTLGFDAERNKLYAFLPKTHRAAVYVDQD